MFGGVFPPQRRFRHFLARQLTVSTSLVCIYFARFFPSELRHFGGITLLISTVSWEAKGIWDLGSRFFFLLVRFIPPPAPAEWARLFDVFRCFVVYPTRFGRHTYHSHHTTYWALLS